MVLTLSLVDVSWRCQAFSSIEDDVYLMYIFQNVITKYEKDAIFFLTTFQEMGTLLSERPVGSFVKLKVGNRLEYTLGPRT